MGLAANGENPGHGAGIETRTGHQCIRLVDREIELAAVERFLRGLDLTLGLGRIDLGRRRRFAVSGRDSLLGLRLGLGLWFGDRRLFGGRRR